MSKQTTEWEDIKHTRNSIGNPKVGLIFPVCDGDEKHFKRFYDELTRLAFPFVAHFDHCKQSTKDLFSRHPLCVARSVDDDPNSFFGEEYRQRPLDILIKLGGFTHYIHMDVDETLELDAPAKIAEISRAKIDVAVFRCLDLWGDKKHYRVDGVFAGSRRDKVFRIVGNHLKYPHPTSHAPNVTPHGKSRDAAIVSRCPVDIFHWGIMDFEDAKVHKERWDRVYTKRVGRNPYGGYDYYFDPATVVKLGEIPDEKMVPGVDR